MKFAIAQEISRHVRDKLCKFYNTNKTEHITTCTITSNEAAGGEGAAAETEAIVENAETSTSQSSIKTFAIITSDSIKYPTMVDDNKVHIKEESPSQGLDLMENNFTDILSPSAFQITVPCNDDTEEDDNEFGMIIGEIDNNEEQVVEILFSCKLCDFR